MVKMRIFARGAIKSDLVLYLFERSEKVRPE
jgi:hypothetical protein